MARLDTLPVELLLDLTEYESESTLPFLGLRDLASLTLVNRQLHKIFNPILWKLGRAAISWAARKDRIDVLEKALEYKVPLYSMIWFHPSEMAAKHGCDNALSWLIDHGVPIDPPPPLPIPDRYVSNRFSPLYAALWEGRQSMAVMLLSRGAKHRFWECHSIDGDSAMHMAARRGFIKVIVYMVKTMGIDVNGLDKRSRTPLHYAVQKPDNDETIKTLVELGADINAERNAQGPSTSLLPLTAAIISGCFSNAMLLMDYGANASSSMPDNPMSPLIVCTLKEDATGNLIENERLDQQEQLLRRLLAGGANPHASFPGIWQHTLEWPYGVNLHNHFQQDYTALDMALQKGTDSVVACLLRAGEYDGDELGSVFYLIGKEIDWSRKSDVDLAIRKAELLCAAGARLDVPGKIHPGPRWPCLTPLNFAIFWHDKEPEMLHRLIDKATPQNCCEGYLNILLESCLGGHDLAAARVLMTYGATSDLVKEKLFFGAYASLKRRWDTEPSQELRFNFCLDFLSNVQLIVLLHEALCSRNDDACQILINRGVLSLSKGIKPWLHLAAKGGSIALVQRLCESGMDINELDENFKTPMIWAVEADKMKVADLLFRLGADPFHPRPDAKCRQLPNIQTQVISPFELAIRKDRVMDVRSWLLQAPPESRPSEEFYIPRVLAKGPEYSRCILAFLTDGKWEWDLEAAETSE